MPLSDLAKQLSKFAEVNDVEGMAALLESWPVADRCDDWMCGVESRMHLPSSTDDQKARMRVLWKEFEETNRGSNLQLIRTSLAVVNKLIDLEDSNADLETPEVSQWLDSFTSIGIYFERLKRVPESLCRMRNLERLDLVELQLPRKVSAVPDSIASLEKLQLLNVTKNRLKALQRLPTSLKTLVVSGNTNLQLDVSGLKELETLYLDRLQQSPVGIADLKSLKKLSWRESECESFPIEFLELPELSRHSIDLEDSDMELPDPPPLESFSASYTDAEMDQIAQSMMAFNAAVEKMHTDEDDGFDCYTLVKCEPATDGILAAFAEKSGVPLPASLEKFYRTIGGLQHRYCSETHSISIPPAEHELESLTSELGPLKSTGLIDTISWSYSGQIEPDVEVDGIRFSQEELDLLNRRYTCFGSRLNEWGFEASHYLYFDDQGKFGSIYYNQNGDHDFETQLREMVTTSPATATLSELIAECLATIEQALRERED